MSLYKRILVGVDLNSNGVGLTTGARDAAARGIQEAKASGASLTFLHSTRPDETHTRLSGASDIVHEGLSSAAKDALDGLLADAHKAGVEAKTKITDGRPWIDMILCAVRGEVDLIVVGKRNAPSQDGRRIGSVANKLLRKCPCAVLVVRPEDKPAHQLVLAATDLSPTGDKVLRAAAEMAKLHGGTVHAVHAWSTPFALQMGPVRTRHAELAAHREKLGQAVTDEISEALAGQDSRGEIEVHIGHGAPSKILQEAVDHLKPSLLVMGTLSYSGIAGMLMGSTAERMLDRVDCSILALKPDDFVSPITE